MFFLLISITLSTIANLVYSSTPYCTYYPHYNYEYNVGQKITIPDQLDMENKQPFGIGFWMSYQPINSGTLENNPDSTISPYIKSMYVFSYEFLESEIYSLLFYVEIFSDTSIINHNMLILTTNQIKSMTLQMNYNTYEGDWIFVYCYIDQYININYYSFQENYLQSQKLEESIVLNTDMVHITGGYKNVQINDNQILYLEVYTGIIYPVIINYYDSFIDYFDNFLQECSPIPICDNETPIEQIKYNVSMTGNILNSKSSLTTRIYVLKGWIKKSQLQSTISKEQSLLLRITINKDYSDNKQIGDRLIYILYYQDNINHQQNGFTLQTYSYTSLIKPKNYISDDSDTIYVLGEEYKDLITQWHYFQLEVGTYSNNGQPIYTVYYSGNDNTVQYTWDKQINHFKSQELYFEIGGDQFYPNPFKGYLSNWSFIPLCNVEEINFQPLCHYSCLKCKGISSNDCTSCNAGSLRVFSESQHTCRCQYSYVDTPFKQKCQKLQTYNPIFNIQEIELINKTNQIVCDIGYFQYNNTCFQCPYQAKTNLINCADCFLYPDIFSQNLNCTFKLNTTQKDLVFTQTNLNTEDIELYQITNDLQLKLRKGFLEDGKCKNANFLQNNNECKQCLNNCEQCKNEFSCEQCFSQYIQDYNGVCVYCDNCVIKELIVLQEGTVENMYCLIGQYLKDDMCYNCGNHCLDCSEFQCYRCDDPKYFITLDQFNCAKCSIENCQYCVQYIIKSDNTIINSIDTGVKFAIFYSDMKIACALCNQDYFYSFETNQCEQTSMIDCQSGIILDSQTQCLISDKRQDAIQQSICSDQQCLSCINNYSQNIDQFCIVCKIGYYSNFNTGECKKCPNNCQTCSHFSDLYQDNWQWNIRAFYQYFINKNKDHFFQTYYKNQVSVICFSCLPNYYLSQQTCVQGCSDDCLDCQSLYLNHQTQYFFCNKCKSETFNLQRSVDPSNLSQCLACPDYCLACYPRTTNEIKTLNQFFNENSQYRKYSHKCYQIKSETSQISIKPQYFVSNICQIYNQCEKILSMSFYLYCDSVSWQAGWKAEKDLAQRVKYQLFQNMFYQNILENLLTEEMYDYFNKVVITEITYNLEIIHRKNDRVCQIHDNLLNITNKWKSNVFALQRTNLYFWRSQKSQTNKIPMLIDANFTIRNFDKITFENIQFTTYNQKYPILELVMPKIQFHNDYDLVSVYFLNCEITQPYWKYSKSLTFTSNRPQYLLIQKMMITELQIHDSFIFDLQPLKENNSKQQIFDLTINSSNFTNTSIFMYNAQENSLHQIVNLTNVTITNSNFSESFFINSSFLFDYNIGNLYLENIYLENLQFFKKSVFVKITSAIAFQIKNLTVKNVRFSGQSSLLFSNLITLHGMEIVNSYIESGYFISIYQQTLIKRNYITTNELIFSNISYQNNTYFSSNSFLQILQDQFTKNTFVCTGLFLDNNIFINSTLGIQSFSYTSYKQSLIYIDCTSCTLINIQIQRGIGLPEISLINSKQLWIENLYIKTQEQYYKRSLHSSVECGKKYIYLDIPFVLYIGFYQNVSLNNVQVRNTLVVDYQIIGFFGQSLIESIQTENIIIENSIFSNNILVVMNKNRQSSILLIETQQKSNIQMRNIEFDNNLLNEYYQNTIQHSSTTLLVYAQLGQLQLDSSKFIQNIITNSSNSVLFLQIDSLMIINSKFVNQNILRDEIFKKNLIAFDLDIQYWDIQNEFSILSNGGSGYFEMNNLLIRNTSIRNSQARNGGGFYITTAGDGIIIVENCSFINTSSIGNLFSSGGLLYIDSSKSIVNLTIKNCQIQSAYSKSQGGVIYIDPSRSFNSINLDYLVIQQVFSMQHSFLSFSPTKQISITSQVSISNSKIKNTESDFDQFLEQQTDIQQQNIILFQTNNPLIYVQFCKFIMVDCQFDNMHLASLLEIEQGIDISLRNIQIFNGTILQSPIFKLSLQTDNGGTILMQNLVILNLNQFTPNNPLSIQNTVFLYRDLLCPLSQNDITNQVKIVKNQLDLNNQLNYNKDQMYKIITNQAFSLIEINKLKSNHLVNIRDFQMSQIQCSSCGYGLLSVKEIKKLLNLQITNLQMFNNICGIIGCLTIIKSIENINLLQNQLKNSELQQNAIYFNTSLSHSIIFNNTAHYGAACFISEVDILINQTIFSDNKATMLGGSIYYISNNTSLLITNSKIVKNTALIGGGIYLKNQQLQQFEKINLFLQENSGNTFANNLYELPRFLYFSLNEKDKFQNVRIFQNSTTNWSINIFSLKSSNRRSCLAILYCFGNNQLWFYLLNDFKNYVCLFCQVI